jgi:butyryl-CoA dehydrogenase
MWYLTDERQLVLDATKEFVRTEVAPQVAHVEKTSEFPMELFKRAGELGLIGLTIPAEYGGSGVDQTASALVLEEIAKTMPVLTIAMGAHALLAGGLIQMLGTDEQKRKWLAPAATGEKILACASTEPVGGDNQVEFSTRAVRDGDGWVINGAKCLICNVGVADYYVVIAVTAEQVDPITKAGISCFVVPADAPGLKVGEAEHKLGWRGSATGSVYFDDVRVPADALVGPEGGCLQAMFVSASAEFLSCGPVSLGIAEGAYAMALDYSMTRTQQGHTMFDRFQVTRHKLARMWGEIESLRALVYSTYAQRDAGELELAKCRLMKIKGAEVSEYVCREAIQLFGGVGTIVDTGVERYWRDAKVMAIGGASVEALVDVVAGLVKAGRA